MQPAMESNPAKALSLPHHSIMSMQVCFGYSQHQVSFSPKRTWEIVKHEIKDVTI